MTNTWISVPELVGKSGPAVAWVSDAAERNENACACVALRKFICLTSESQMARGLVMACEALHLTGFRIGHSAVQVSHPAATFAAKPEISGPQFCQNSEG